MDSFTKYVIDVLGYVPEDLGCFDPSAFDDFDFESALLKSQLDSLKRYADYLDKANSDPIIPLALPPNI